MGLPLVVTGRPARSSSGGSSHEARHQQGVWTQRDAEVEQSRRGLVSTVRKLPRTMADSRFCRWAAGVGTTTTMAMAARASRAMEPETGPTSPRAWVMRAGHHGDGEGDAKTHPDEGHGLGAILLPGEIRQERHDGGGDGAAPLQGTPDDDPQMESLRGGDDAARANISKPPTMRAWCPTCRRAGRRDLEQGLGHAVDADGKPDERLRGARQGHAVGGQYRQHHKHAEHAQREDRPSAQVARRSPLVMVKIIS